MSGFQGRVVAVFLLATAAISLGAVDRVADRLFPPPLERIADLSIEVVDAGGVLLRPFANSQGRWRLAVDLDRLDPRFVDLLLAYEDRRFPRHSGVDPLAVARAVWQLVSQGRVVSGGSTITMQLARLIEPEPRTVPAKLRQMWRAVQLERRLSKRQILAAYLTLAPYGGNIEGLRAASLAWYGRGIGHLPPAEAALLVALPQSPEARRPDRHPEAARQARDRVLQRAMAGGILDEGEARAAMARPVPSGRRDMPALAAHLAANLATANGPGRIETTLDAGLQRRIEGVVAAHARRLGTKASLAVLVAEHATGRVRAHVGSPDAFDATRLGAIDMTAAVRSPGSALKPFIYGLAFEAGLAHPETLIDDRPTDFSGYAPRNFDSGYRGTVSMREALSLSLNIPAVEVLAAVGPGRFVTRLARAGADARVPEGGTPGLAVALGGVGTTLTDLVRLYGTLARGGAPMPLHAAGPPPPAPGQGPLLSPEAAWYVADILATTPPPEAALRGRIAYKTGTSYGYRDAWAVGFDGRHVIGVWAGRADGTPLADISGYRTAAPVLFEAFARLGKTLAGLPAAPSGALAGAVNTDLPAPMRRFGRPPLAAGAGRNTLPLSITFPPAGAHLEGVASGALALKAAGGDLPLTWFANGRPVAVSERRRHGFWVPDGRGFSDVSVVDAAGRAAHVRVFLD